MIGGSITAAMPGRKGLRLLAASLFAALVLSLTGWTGAYACPTGSKSHHAAAEHPLKSNKPASKHVTVFVRSLVATVASARHRCAGPPSTAGSCCKSGCCSAGFALAEPGHDGVERFWLHATYDARVQDQLKSLSPPGHFRPPQAAA